MDSQGIPVDPVGSRGNSCGKCRGVPRLFIVESPAGPSGGKSHGGKSRGTLRDARWEHEGAHRNHEGVHGTPWDPAGTYGNTRDLIWHPAGSRGTLRRPMGSLAGYRGMTCWDPVASRDTPTGARFHGIPPKTQSCTMCTTYQGSGREQSGIVQGHICTPCGGIVVSVVVVVRDT